MGGRWVVDGWQMGSRWVVDWWLGGWLMGGRWVADGRVGVMGVQEGSYIFKIHLKTTTQDSPYHHNHSI